MYRISSGILGLVLLFPGLALAHTGAGAGAGFLHGATHPFSGLDHLLAMLAVGLWAAQAGGRALWAVPMTFVGIMVLGGALGVAGIGMPYMEQGIIASVMVLGVFVAGALRLPAPVSVAIVAAFALFHGAAHGTEMPVASAFIAPYVLGFVLATALIHAGGIALGLLASRSDLHLATRLAGGFVAFSGVYLAVT